MMRDQRRKVEDGEGGAIATVWVDARSDCLVVLLSDILQRPEGASGPASLEVELGADAPLATAAERLEVAGSEVVDALVERFAGKPQGLLEWVRALPESELWSHTDDL